MNFCATLVVAALAAGLCAGRSPQSQRNKIILISMSGLRHDYVNFYGLPTMQRFIKEGVSAGYMNTPFITNTYPALWTIATGLYPEDHGIIDNKMFDVEADATFKNAEDESSWYQSAEPIWISAEKQGIRTAVSSWPGNLAMINGKRTSHAHVINDDDTPEQVDIRITGMVKWLSEGVDLGLIQLPQPDNIAHEYGPVDFKVQEAMQQNDLHLKHLFDSLKEKDLDETTNIIVVGDHGMTEHHGSKVIYLSDKVEINDLRWYTGSIFTSGMLLPRDGLEDKVYQQLKSANHPHLTVYKKSEIPDEFHLKNHRHVLPILLIADKGWRIQLLKPIVRTQPSRKVYGMHGYIHTEMDMKPAMFARGPDFASGKNLTSIDSIDLYPLMCSILNMDRCHNSPGNIHHIGDFVKHTPVDRRGVQAARLDNMSSACALTTSIALLSLALCHSIW